MINTLRALNCFKNVSTARFRVLSLVTIFFSSLSLQSSSQTLTPSASFVIEANTSSVWPMNSYYGNHFIFPNGKIGITMNDERFRLYEPSGSLIRTIDLEAAVGYVPRRVIGLTNNNILLLNQTTFSIIDQQGVVILPQTSTGFSNYANNNNLDAVELSNGNLALASYSSASEPIVRVMTQSGAFVSGIINIKSAGTGRPSPINNQFYSGNLAASKNGGFLFAYRTYLMGPWGMLFDNDGNMRTWPSTGLNHYKLGAANPENFELTDLPNGNFMLHFPWNKTSNLIIDGNGNTVSSSVSRAFFASSSAINRKGNNGYYVTITPDENIGMNWDGSDDFTGNAGIYAEVRNLDGTQAIAATQIATGYFDVQWNDEEWYYTPDIRPGTYPVSSLNGASGYGMIILNPLGGNTYSLSLNLYEINLSTLPVKLESFTGKATTEGNLLEWLTSSEVNADRFEIEYSTTGINFEKIGEVATGSNNYSFLHTSANDIAYYRLKSVDIDGRFEYSKIIKIVNDASASRKVNIYPVPATDHFTVSIEGFVAGERVPYSIVNGVGAIVKNGFISTNNQRVDLVNVKPGVYYISIKNLGSKKLLVK